MVEVWRWADHIDGLTTVESSGAGGSGVSQNTGYASQA